MKHPEHSLQCAIVRYLSYKYPKVLFCGSAGGIRASSIVQGALMKQAGYKAGFPDLFIYHPAGSYSGLAIELKAGKKGRVSPEQQSWIERLNERGYRAVVCRGIDEAMREIDEYLKK